MAFTLRLEKELEERVKAEAKRVYMPVNVWITQAVLEKLEGVGETVSGEGKPKLKLTREYKGDVKFFYGLDQGSHCPGSGSEVSFSETLGKYPAGVCGVCQRLIFGLPGKTGVVLREHKDGKQTDGDLEEVDRSLK